MSISTPSVETSCHRFFDLLDEDRMSTFFDEVFMLKGELHVFDLNAVQTKERRLLAPHMDLILG